MTFFRKQRTLEAVDDVPNAYARAQRTHQLEHAAGLDLSLECDAVGHLPLSDCYQSLSTDYRRKFCIATGRDW